VIHKKLIEGKDYYVEAGLFVFTSKYLQDRGYCCKSNCRHCPYGFAKQKEKVNKEEKKNS